jgi:phage protein D/phage baseplate assembly protein gpV
MPAEAERHVSGLAVNVDGSPLAPEYLDRIRSVKVSNVRMLPDACTLQIQDPRSSDMDRHPLKVGAMLEIKMGQRTAPSVTRVFKGQIASVEPSFKPGDTMISVRAYDLAHKLNRARNTKAWQNQTSSDIVKAVAGAAGLSPGTVDSSGSPHPYMAQVSETDWGFCWRLADMHDFEFVVEDSKFHFRDANANHRQVRLVLGEELRTFRPRATGVQQVKQVEVRGYDPTTKQTFLGTASSPVRSSRIGIDPSQLGSDLGGGTVALADMPVFSQDEANRLAQARLNQMGNAAVEAEGVAFGTPDLLPGVEVKVEGVGTKFSGSYTITSTEHAWSTGGYETTFKISGRSPRTLTSLTNPKPQRSFADSLVIGLVTNNKDPDSAGRVKVKFPTLDNVESAWARVATPSAGKERGLLMLPVVDEEVVVAFEAGDIRKPVVLGSVFNGKDVPGEELAFTDGSFGLKSDKKILIKSADGTSILTAKDLTIEIGGSLKEKVSGSVDSKVDGSDKRKVSGSVNYEASGSVTIKGSSMTLEATGSLTIKAPTVTVQGSGQLNLKGGMVNIGP